jgi:CDP-glycerol glycerophosphotransferase
MTARSGASGRWGIDHGVGEYVGMLAARGTLREAFQQSLEAFVGRPEAANEWYEGAVGRTAAEGAAWQRLADARWGMGGDRRRRGPRGGDRAGDVMTRDTIVFNAWHGRCCDSPGAIAAELRRRGAGLREVWIADEGAAIPPGVIRVDPDGPEELAELARARWIVSNDVLPHDFAKAAGATYLQTWHGTPLKRIAFDVRNPTFPDAEYHYRVELGREVAKWDVLLSPNAFSTDVLRNAFRFDRPVLETGYPRNDVLLAPDRDAVRARVREELGIDDATRAVLYAPTWRDSFDMTLELDLDELHRRLGDDTVVLVRAHGLTAKRARLSDGPGYRDVTRWPSIAELYLAADVLLTDYSSAMFDFALTGRPMLFYTYDLEHFRDRMRGSTSTSRRARPGRCFGRRRRWPTPSPGSTPSWTATARPTPPGWSGSATSTTAAPRLASSTRCSATRSPSSRKSSRAPDRAPAKRRIGRAGRGCCAAPKQQPRGGDADLRLSRQGKWCAPSLPGEVTILLGRVVLG